MTRYRDRTELPQRAKRYIGILEGEGADQAAWARTVFAAIATAGDLDRVRRLARLAIVAVDRGASERLWLSEMMEKPGAGGICLQCSRVFNGTAECASELYEAVCPRAYADFADGVTPVAYAEFSTSVRAA